MIASDVKNHRTNHREDGPFVYCDVQDKDNLARIILENGINCVVHLATLLSAVGERNPTLALKINTTGIQNILELAAAHNLQVVVGGQDIYTVGLRLRPAVTQQSVIPARCS